MSIDLQIDRDPVRVPARRMGVFLVRIIEQFDTRVACAEYFGVAPNSMHSIMRKSDWCETHIARALRRPESAVRIMLEELGRQYGSDLDTLAYRQVEPEWRAYLAFDEYSAPYGTEEDLVIAYRQRAGLSRAFDNGNWSPERIRIEANEAGLDGEYLAQRVLARQRIDRSDSEGDDRETYRHTEPYSVAPGVAV